MLLSTGGFGALRGGIWGVKIKSADCKAVANKYNFTIPPSFSDENATSFYTKETKKRRRAVGAVKY